MSAAQDRLARTLSRIVARGPSSDPDELYDNRDVDARVRGLPVEPITAEEAARLMLEARTTTEGNTP